jgi:hypothetical protein
MSAVPNSNKYGPYVENEEEYSFSLEDLQCPVLMQTMKKVAQFMCDKRHVIDSDALTQLVPFKCPLCREITNMSENPAPRTKALQRACNEVNDVVEEVFKGPYQIRPDQVGQQPVVPVALPQQNGPAHLIVEGPPLGLHV